MMYRRVKNEILGKDYSLSLARVSARKSQEFNYRYRGKNKPANVLAFPLSKKAGELLLCPVVIKKEARAFGKSFDQLENEMVIHGMLHLKGLRHGSIMERAEKKYGQKYFHRYRRGHSNHQSGGR